MDICFKGGWPELHKDSVLSVVSYLNDYIRSYLEKDVSHTVGIQKTSAFLNVLRLSAARTAQLLNLEDLSKDSGVKSPTVKSWLGVLARLGLAMFLEPWHSNLNKRLIKSPKFYLLDTGLIARLQGYTSAETFFKSPTMGAAFESLVLAEIVKTRANFQKDWELFFYRNKEKEEVDFVVKSKGRTLFLDAKMAIQNISPKAPPKGALLDFPGVKEWYFVSWEGSRKRLSENCEQVPVRDLARFLIEYFD